MKHYFLESIPFALDAEQQYKLMASTFTGMLLTVLVLHQFLPFEQPIWSLLIHALLVAISYSLCALGIVGLIYLNRDRFPKARLRVWHFWLVSFLVFNLGFLLNIPLNSETTLLLHKDLTDRTSMLHYGRLLPIWGLFTYTILHVYLVQTVKNELSLLKNINEQLTLKVEGSRKLPAVRIGKKIVASPSDISHVSVDDHHCYIHYQRNENWQKEGVASPLKAIVKILPDHFVQIHRSHLVNPHAVIQVKKQKRNFYVVMRSGIEVPISRAKRDTVLSKLADIKCISPEHE